MTPKELKQELSAAGFQVYKSEASQLQLALRVRDNLIMDSGVWVTFDPQQVLKATGTHFGVRCVFRSQLSDHRELAESSHASGPQEPGPAESEHEGFARARELAKALGDTGYVECATRVVTVENPSHPGDILDTWWEVIVEKGALCWDELLTELRLALQTRKIA